MARTRIVLQHHFALGDSVLLTAVARDLDLTYPGRFEILVDAHFREVFEHNPHCRIVKSEEKTGSRKIAVAYGEGITTAGRGQKVHMLSWYHLDLGRKLSLSLRPKLPHGDIHLAPHEQESFFPGKRYWVMIAGGKTDITCKWWWPQRYQEVVDAMNRLGLLCVQAGALHREHRHPQLTGVVDMLGKCPSSRDLFRLIAHADGVICPVTAAMHVAAAFEKPCVVLSGGREEPWWEAYVNTYNAFGSTCAPVRVPHRFLHTIGQLDCCKAKGCWKHRTVPLADRSRWDETERRCKLPVLGEAPRRDVPGFSAPKCLDMITTDHVVEAVMSYYDDKTLPPIGEPKGDYRHVTTPTAPPPKASKMIELPGFELPAQTGGITKAALQDAFTILEQQKPEPVLWKGPPDPRMLDHVLLGGRLTVFVLCFGDHPNLARSCIESILSTIPAHRLDLRVGLNAVCEETRAYVKGLGVVTHVYDSPENIKKYPLMRKMFHDRDLPIRTPYAVWFDDDAKVVDPAMWSKLCETIIANHANGCRLYGWQMVHDTAAFARNGNNPAQWFKNASWWRNRHLRVRGRAQEAPNGSVVEFVSGWFWAIAAETIRLADIPCPRLNHNGGDITIGEQVHQSGGKLKMFNKDKISVWCPTKEKGGRRGYSEAFPWQHKS